MPDEIQYDASATPAQFTNNADIVIEQGTHVRVKIIGLRTEVGEMWAIGSINGDFLGSVPPDHVVLQSRVVMLTRLTTAAVCRHRNPTDRHGAPIGEGERHISMPACGPGVTWCDLGIDEGWPRLSRPVFLLI